MLSFYLCFLYFRVIYCKQYFTSCLLLKIDKSNQLRLIMNKHFLNIGSITGDTSDQVHLSQNSRQYAGTYLIVNTVMECF